RSSGGDRREFQGSRRSEGGNRSERRGGFQDRDGGRRSGPRRGSYERDDRQQGQGSRERDDRQGGAGYREGGRDAGRRNSHGGAQVVLTVGSEDSVTKQDILQTLQGSGTELRALGSIRVIARRTFISADPEACIALAKTLDGATIGNRRVRAKVE